MMIDTLEKPSTELTVQARAALAMVSDKTRQDLLVMATKYTAITEIKNSAGRAECHSAAMTLASARIAISKIGKATRDEATKFSKAVIQEEASLIAITEPEEKRLLALRDSWDMAVAAEKAAKEAAERTRIAAHMARIATIREYVPMAAGCRTAARVNELIGKMSLIGLTDFEEFTKEAVDAHAESMERVSAIFHEKTEQEAEQAEAAQKLAAERAEFEAAKAEQEANAKRNRDAAIEEADRLATERQRLDDERKAFQAQVAEAGRVAAQAEADRIEAQRELDETTAQETEPDSAPALAVHAQDAIETEASVSNPSDADLMWVAICAVAKEYDWSTEQATARLAAVQWTL